MKSNDKVLTFLNRFTASLNSAYLHMQNLCRVDFVNHTSNAAPSCKRQVWNSYMQDGRLIARQCWCTIEELRATVKVSPGSISPGLYVIPAKQLKCVDSFFSIYNISCECWNESCFPKDQGNPKLRPYIRKQKWTMTLQQLQIKFIFECYWEDLCQNHGMYHRHFWVKLYPESQGGFSNRILRTRSFHCAKSRSIVNNAACCSSPLLTSPKNLTWSS